MPNNSITIDGTQYPSLMAASRELGIPYDRLRKRLVANMPEDKLITADKQYANKKEILYKHMSFPSIQAFADYFGVPYSSARRKLASGKTPDVIIAKQNKKILKKRGYI